MRTIGDVVVNNASVCTEQSGGGFGDVFQIRGFTVQATDVALNGLYGMVSAARVPVDLHRVEVLNGPSSLMYGLGPGSSVDGRSTLSPSAPTTRHSISRRGNSARWLISAGASAAKGQFKDGQTGIAHGNKLQGDGAVGLDYRGKQFRCSFVA